MFLTFSIHFRTSKYFVLFVVIFLLRLDSLASKSVFLIKFACANLALKTSVESLVNSRAVIYLSWLWLVSLFLILVIFVLWSVFSTNLLIVGILFSTAINTLFVS